MSRIIIKNLPSKADSTLIKKHFSSFGTISDIKLVKDKLGNKKNYAFIGYLEKKAAEKCIDGLDNCFIETRRINIEKVYLKKSGSDTTRNGLNLEKKEQVFHSELLEGIKETGQLFIRNLPHGCKEEELKELFKPFGFISLIKILRTNQSNTKSCIAIVGFGLPECALKAGSFLDGKVFKGKILHIIPSKRKFKIFDFQKKETFLETFQKTRTKLEQNSKFDSRSWFWFFFPKEFLIQGLFRKIDWSKKKEKNHSLFNFNSGNLSISESRLQYEVTIYLEKQGIDLKIMNPLFLTKKSKKIFLIKNFSSTKFFIERKKMEKFGKIKRLISFPLINLFFIEYKKKKNARAAFTYFSLLTQKEGFFLEWAPYNCIQTNSKNKMLTEESLQKNKFDYKIKRKTNILKNEKRRGVLKNPSKKYDPEISKKAFKLLVRNLPFRTRIWDLRKMFVPMGGVISIRMPKKKNGSFRGFAFIIFNSLEKAKSALFFTQGIHLFSRRLIPSIIS